MPILRNCQSAFFPGMVLLILVLSGAISADEPTDNAQNESRGGRLRERFRNRQTESKPRPPASGAKSGEALEIAGLKVNVWRSTGDRPGTVPLVIFSHGFHGSSTQSKFLMAALADDGYLVIAPNHRDAVRAGKMDEFSFRPDVGFGKPDDWSDDTYRDRASDIQSLLVALKNDPKWNAMVDWERVTLAGHSLGGYTVLGLAGGWPSWKPEGVKIKAVLALSPYCTPFIRKQTLGKLETPVLYQGGTRDFGITPFVKRSGGAFDATSAPAYFVEFDGAGHFAWTDLKTDHHPSIEHYSIAFLDKHLGRGNPDDLARKLADVSELKAK
jgi:predicted dienelactone hydrolase